MAGYQANKLSPAVETGGGCAARQSQISEQLDYLGNAVSSLASLLGDLESRLSGVVMPVPPPPPTGKDVAEPILVPVAEAVKVQTSRLRSLSCQIESLLSRLEL